MAGEFFTVRTLSDVRAGFRPSRRTPIERVPLSDAFGRIAATSSGAPQDLPGFARATVDGFAVRAADTFGASEAIPTYLALIGSVAMGSPAAITVESASAVAIPTGAVLPARADAVVMVEHTGTVMEGMIEVVRPVAPGDGIVRADEDAAAGSELTPPGRPLRAQDLALLAAAGIAAIDVYGRPTVAVLATGDEVVAATTTSLAPGQVRDATTSGLCALIAEAGGRADPRGIIADDRSRLAAALRDAIAAADVVVVSAGSSVGQRDTTAAAVAELGAPGVWCHGLAIKPGKPTLLADCSGVPVIGLPGNPLSALVVFRLVGMPIVRLVGGRTVEPVAASVRAVLARDVPSAPGRLDVVQVRLVGETAEPLFGKSALLSVLTRADGYVVIDEPAAGLYGGTVVEVVPYR